MNNVFEKSIEQRDNGDITDRESEFVFYDGPPFANGLPHYGHLLAGYVKDTFARYQTMKGKKVDRDYRKCWADLPVQFKKPS